MIKLKFRKKLISPGGTLDLDIDTNIDTGDFVTIYGTSGAGKTTMLKIISGLLKPDEGFITVNDKVWFDSDTSVNLRPQSRPAGLVFQDYALFPNMTVEENIFYAAKKGLATERIKEIIDLMDLGRIQNQKPDTLSGGQKQRVALARSLANMPAVLMLDEPMAALDLEMRQRIQNYLLEAHKRYNLTTILVSHDIGEIFKLSNNVLILEEGKIIHQGSPSAIYSNQDISGKFQFAGEIINITKEDVIYVVTVLIDQQIVKVVAEESTANDLNVGDKVIVAAKAFNPIIQKVVKQN
ncbi:MAG: ATP-binding cassette domain-containing protein [Bacteroidota bacterium]